MPLFEFDQAKSEANKAKHGIDFIEAQELWQTPLLIIATGYVEELRWLAIGDLSGRFWTAVYTERAEVIRLISARRSRDHEVQGYEKDFG